MTATNEPVELPAGWKAERWIGGEVHLWQKVGDLTTAEVVIAAADWQRLVEALEQS